jgi:Tfp pilus assembly protein PilO
MGENFKLRKQIILTVVGLLILADVVLAVYAYRLNLSPHAPQQVLARENLQLELQRADIKRAKSIRQRIPAIRKGFDQFEASLIPSSRGYSSLASEIGSVATKAGVKVDEVHFHQKEVPTRGLSEVEIESTVSGDYANVVRFLNGLQRSQNVYAVESLALAPGDTAQNPSGAIRVNLHMKTYFRIAG